MVCRGADEEAKMQRTLEHVEIERDGEIAVVSMNRPEKRNALSLQMMRELDEALALLGEERETRVIVLRGEGPAFSAGHDLRELVDRDVETYRQIFEACVALMARIASVPQPVIAEVARVATAAGCQLVAACDLAVASSEATFATPGVRIGLFCSTPMVALTRNVGRKRAMEMLLTGDPIDAGTALAWGLVNRVVAPERLHDEVLEMARENCVVEREHRRNRKGRVLRADGSRSVRRVRLYEGSDDGKRAGVRRARRHHRVLGKTPAALARVARL